MDRSDTRYINAKTGEHPFQIKSDTGKRPNIFLISVDMIPTEVYRQDGRYTPHLNIPNIKSLFGDSVQFRNAFCTSPLCGPSRASYLTGRYTYITVNEERAHDGHEAELRPTDVIFPEYLKRVGYLNKHVGKCHIGTQKFMDAFGENDRPWNRWAPPITDDDDYLKYLRDMGIKPMRYKREVRGLQQDRKSPGNSYGGWVEASDGSPFPLEATYPYFLGSLAAEKLTTAIHQSADGDKPIYFQLDFFAPHQPFVIPDGFEDRAEELMRTIELPAGYLAASERNFGASEHEPRIYQFYRKYWGLYDPDTVRNYILCNLLQMEVLDKALGIFMDELKRSGLYDDSLIIFIGDHGEMNCEGALVDKGVYGHPKTMRVPLSVKPGAHLGAQASCLHSVDSPVSLLDVAPTVMETVGVQPTERLDGESLLPLMSGAEVKRESPILFEAGWHVAPNPAVSIQWSPGDGDLYMYTYNLTSEVDELYNMSDDSYRNLSFDDGYRDVKQAMIEKMANILRADDRWRCYWHTFRIDKYRDLPTDGEDAQMFIPKH